MYNDVPDVQKQKSHSRFDHAPYAFLAAKAGELDFLQVLLGPSIHSERYEREKLLADVQELYDRENLWEFKKQLLKANVDILKSHPEGDIHVLSEKLAACVEPLVKTSLDEWVERVNKRGAVIYHPESPVFPSIDIADFNEPDSLKKMSLFFKRWEDVLPNDRGFYFIRLPKFEEAIPADIISGLRNILERRYIKIVKNAYFKIENMTNLAGVVASLEASIWMADKHIDDILRQKSILNDRVCEFDLRYDERKRGISTLVDKFEAKPYLLPSAYRVSSPELKQLLESAKVPVNVRDEAGNTLIHVASQAREYNVVRLLLDHGADLNPLNDNRLTPSDLAGLKSAAELASLAKVYKKRSESEFLADVVRDFQLYKKGHEETLASSFKRRLHFRSDERLDERTKQLADLEAGIEKAKKFPTDDLLMVNILVKNSQATRGKLGRSHLFDPLMAHVKRYLEGKGYGISKEDIFGAFNTDYLLVINEMIEEEVNARIRPLVDQVAASQLNNEMKDVLIKRLNSKIKEKDELLAEQADLLSKKDETIASYQIEIMELATEHEEFAKLAAEKIEMLVKTIESLSGRLTQQGSELPAKLTGDEAGVSVSGAHAALFNASHSLNASEGRILLETLENAPTLNRPN